MKENFWIIYKKGWKNCVIFYPVLQKKGVLQRKRTFRGEKCVRKE